MKIHRGGYPKKILAQFGYDKPEKQPPREPWIRNIYEYKSVHMPTSGTPDHTESVSEIPPIPLSSEQIASSEQREAEIEEAYRESMVPILEDIYDTSVVNGRIAPFQRPKVAKAIYPLKPYERDVLFFEKQLSKRKVRKKKEEEKAARREKMKDFRRDLRGSGYYDLLENLSLMTHVTDDMATQIAADPKNWARWDPHDRVIWSGKVVWRNVLLANGITPTISKKKKLRGQKVRTS